VPLPGVEPAFVREEVIETVKEYTETLRLFSTNCQVCGYVVDKGYRSREQAEADVARMERLDGGVYCDEHWPDRSEEDGDGEDQEVSGEGASPDGA